MLFRNKKANNTTPNQTKLPLTIFITFFCRNTVLQSGKGKNMVFFLHTNIDF